MSGLTCLFQHRHLVQRRVDVGVLVRCHRLEDLSSELPYESGSDLRICVPMFFERLVVQPVSESIGKELKSHGIERLHLSLLIRSEVMIGNVSWRY